MCAVRGRLGIGSVLQEDVRHPCRRCAPSLPKMAYIPDEDGAHPGRAGQTAAAFTDN